MVPRWRDHPKSALHYNEGTHAPHPKIKFLAIIHLPHPPPPLFDIETMKPIELPWQASKEWKRLTRTELK